MSHAEGTAGADVLKQALPFVLETRGMGRAVGVKVRGIKRDQFLLDLPGLG